MSSIRAAFKQARKEAHDDVAMIVYRTTVFALKTIVENSPVWSGAYVRSHRLSVNGAPVAEPVQSPKEIGPRLPDAAAIALRKLVFQEQMAHYGEKLPFSTVVISNDADHARLVEFVGTGFVNARYVYTRTADKVRAKLHTLTR